MLYYSYLIFEKFVVMLLEICVVESISYDYIFCSYFGNYDF